ncbi:MAG: GNAT family N-acetyltransferase [Acidobacteriota bacterium]
MEIKHESNKRKGSFVVDIDGEKLGELQYFVSSPGQITINHTEVDEKLRGQHVGDKLVAATVEYARANGLKIVPACPFAKKVIDRKPEFQDILAGS